MTSDYSEDLILSAAANDDGVQPLLILRRPQHNFCDVSVISGDGEMAAYTRNIQLVSFHFNLCVVRFSSPASNYQYIRIEAFFMPKLGPPTKNCVRIYCYYRMAEEIRARDCCHKCTHIQYTTTHTQKRTG